MTTQDARHQALDQGREALATTRLYIAHLRAEIAEDQARVFDQLDAMAELEMVAHQWGRALARLDAVLHERAELGR